MLRTECRNVAFLLLRGLGVLVVRISNVTIYPNSSAYRQELSRNDYDSVSLGLNAFTIYNLHKPDRAHVLKTENDDLETVND